MIIVLNGPLGCGKTSLAEALSESIARCVLLDGDHLVAVSTPPADECEHLHATIALLVAHHRSFGYRHFVVDHFWSSPAELTDLRQRLSEFDTDIRCFRLTLPATENRRRIERRAAARALDVLDAELRTSTAEREALAAYPGDELGEPLDATPPLAELVAGLSRRLGWR
jgi:hypothetical protein